MKPFEIRYADCGYADGKIGIEFAFSSAQDALAFECLEWLPYAQQSALFRFVPLVRRPRAALSVPLATDDHAYTAE